jgi:hypothetical protein
MKQEEQPDSLRFPGRNVRECFFRGAWRTLSKAPVPAVDCQGPVLTKPGPQSREPARSPGPCSPQPVPKRHRPRRSPAGRLRAQPRCLPGGPGALAVPQRRAAPRFRAPLLSATCHVTSSRLASSPLTGHSGNDAMRLPGGGHQTRRAGSCWGNAFSTATNSAVPWRTIVETLGHRSN